MPLVIQKPRLTCLFRVQF